MKAALHYSCAYSSAGSNHGLAHMEVEDGRGVQRGARSEWAGPTGKSSDFV